MNLGIDNKTELQKILYELAQTQVTPDDDNSSNNGSSSTVTAPDAKPVTATLADVIATLEAGEFVEAGETIGAGDTNRFGATTEGTYTFTELRKLGCTPAMIADCFTPVQLNNGRFNLDAYTLDLDKVKFRFPDTEINTIEDLVNAYESGNIQYTKEEIMAKYGLSEDDIEMFFKLDENTGACNLDPDKVKTRFPDTEINTIEDLVNAYKSGKAQFTKEEIMSKYGLSEDDIEKFFKQDENTGFYKLDSEKLQKYFVDDKIPQTIDELKNADLYSEFIAQFDSGELNVMVTGKEAEEYINILKELLLDKYKNISSISDEYLEKVMDMIIDTLSIEDIYYNQEAGESYWRNRYTEMGYSGEELEQMVRDAVNADIDGTRTNSLIGILAEMNNKFCHLMSKTTEVESFDIYYSNSGRFSERTYKGEFTLAQKIISNLTKEAVEKLGLDKSEIVAFAHIIEGSIGNDTTFAEIIKLIEELSTEVKHMDSETIDSATTINTDELFKDTDSMDAEYILNHLNEMLLSNDAGIRKFAKTIQNAFNNYHLNTDEDKKTLLTTIIFSINNALGSRAFNLELSKPTIQTLVAGQKFETIVSNAINNFDNFKVQGSQVSNNYYQGERYVKIISGDTITVLNPKTGELSTIDLNYICSNLDENDQEKMKNKLKTLPAEVLLDLNIEIGNDLYSGSAEGTAGTYSPKDDIINLNNIIGSTIVHELGHAISYTDGFLDGDSTFKSLFEQCLNDYENDGGKQAKYSHDGGYHQTDGDSGAYATKNEKECFAECYTFLMLGQSMNNELLTNYFAPCLQYVAEWLTTVRNMDPDDRT